MKKKAKWSEDENNKNETYDSNDENPVNRSTQFLKNWTAKFLRDTRKEYWL